MFLFKSVTSMTSRYAAKLLCASAFESLVGDNGTEFNLTATWPPECRSKTPYIRQVSDLGMDLGRKSKMREFSGEMLAISSVVVYPRISLPYAAAERRAHEKIRSLYNFNTHAAHTYAAV